MTSSLADIFACDKEVMFESRYGLTNVGWGFDASTVYVFPVRDPKPTSKGGAEMAEDCTIQVLQHWESLRNCRGHVSC